MVCTEQDSLPSGKSLAFQHSVDQFRKYDVVQRDTYAVTQYPLFVVFSPGRNTEQYL